jgi:hypothetical protein
VGKLLFLMVCLGTAFGCSGSPVQPPPQEEGKGGGLELMSPQLKAFLAAEDLDDVGDARAKIKTLSADDAAAIRSILAKWEDAQAVSNLLIESDLIPEDVRLASLFRGLAEQREPYYGLAAVVGFQGIEADKLSDKERKRVAAELLAIIRKTRDARAKRASLSIDGFISERDAPQVLALLEHADDTVRTNLRAWLFNEFKGRGVEEFADAVRQSGLPAEAQERVIAQFKDWRAKPTDFGPLFGYIPNLRDFQPSAEPGIVRQEK